MADVKTPTQIIESVSPYYKAKKGPAREWKLVYNSSSEALEPVYFWILDAMAKSSDKLEKLIDNFVSTTGSTRFSELTGKGTSMQKQAMEIYGIVNTVIKSVLNLIYDLKEFQVRLKNYDDAKSKNEEVAAAGLLSLKQIWMDQVDIKKGTGSINMLVRDLNFVTLRDAFMAANSVSDVKKMDLNERVKRVLEARVQEFLEWRDRSEVELRKRYQVERTYLRTQVDALKLYSRWAKPYLLAAEQLRMKEPSRHQPELVSVFNTIYLELTLFGQSETDVIDAANNEDLPEEFKNIDFKRPLYSCVLVDFKFRGIPHGAVLGGKVDVSFKAYALNKEELLLLKEKLKESDFDDALKLVEGMTTESLEQLKEDIEEFLTEESDKEAAKAEKRAEADVNPFAPLLGFGAKKPKPKAKEEDKEAIALKKQIAKIKEQGIKQDNHAESIVRNYTEGKAVKSCYAVYDVYKKSHGMASSPDMV